MTSSPHTNDLKDQKDPVIRRGRVDSLTLYEITDHELELLERGSPSSTELNFSIALLSICMSLATTLATASFESDKIFVVFVSATLIGGVLGLYFLIRWIRMRGDMKVVIKKIRDRIKDASEIPPSPPAARIETALGDEQAG